jgi:hypothetical protein
MTMFEVCLSSPPYCFILSVYFAEILTGKVPLGHIAYADFIPLVVKLDVRPERPDSDQPFTVSDSLWSLAEACWEKAPQNRPTASMVCDTIASLRSSNITAQQFDMPPAYSPGVTTSSVPKATLGGFLPDESMTVSHSSTSAPPSNDAATPASGSFSIPQSASDASNDDVVISEILTSKHVRSPRPLPSPGGSIHFPRFDNRNLSTITESSSLSTSSESIHPTTAGSSPRPISLVSHPLPSAASMFPKTTSDRSTDNSGSPHPLRPLPATTEPSAEASARTAQESLNHWPRAVPSIRPSTSPAYSFLRSEMVDTTSAANNGANASTLSLRNDRRWARSERTEDTLSLKSVRHRRPRTAPWTKNTSANEESGAGQPKGFRRLTNWFENRLPSAPGRSLSPVQESSGFRIAIPGRPIPSSKDPSAEMWSLDELLDRWITRSSGE